MEINSQPVEKAVSHPRGYVDVVNIYLTIQGEGPFTGYPAVFIRTAGCNLSSTCKFCDTDFTTNRQLLSPAKIVDMVQALRKSCLVVITGGEPFRQNLSPLVRLLINSGYKVQIETNGTFTQDSFPWSLVSIVCSPKTPIINPELPINFFKYVLDSEHVDEEDGLPTSVLGSGVRPFRPRFPCDVPVYVSPCDEQDEEKNEKNLRAAIQSVLKFNYLLSVQTHKIEGLP